MNFVSPDYYTASFRLGEALACAGRRRILVFLAPDIRHSVSCELRVAGICAGLQASGEPVEIRTLSIRAGIREEAARAFQTFIEESRWTPDAVYAAGDQMAFGVLDEAQRAGLSVPGALSIVGGSGTLFGNADYPSITAMIQPLERIGEEVIAMLQRILCEKTPVQPGRYLPMEFGIGSTTRPEENALLQSGPA